MFWTVIWVFLYKIQQKLMMIGSVVSINKSYVAVLNTIADILMQNCIEVEAAPLGYFFHFNVK